VDRMPGRLAQPWCPYHHAPAGLDCPDRSPDPRQTRRRLAKDLRRETAEAMAAVEEDR